MHEILFVDAEQPFTNTITSALRARGFSVTVIDDGNAVVDVAAAKRPDVIVLCVELPNMSGYSICNALKRHDDLKRIPLLLTSTEATSVTFAQHQKLKTAADAYLAKPFSAADLLEKIGALSAGSGSSGPGSSAPSPGATTTSLFGHVRSWLAALRSRP
jgi:DNA-binding response OmpR family regulator